MDRELQELLPKPFHRHLIGGDWSLGSGSGATEVLNPATEEAVAVVPEGTIDDGLAALDAAEAAAESWRDTPPRRRSDLLRQAYERMTVEAERFAGIIVLENGKPLAEALREIAYAAEFFRWFSEEAVRWPGLARRAPGGGSQMMVMREPVGISLLITPWNVPAAMLTRKLGAALAAGCTVVVKPASQTPLTTLAIAAMLGDIGVPLGVVNVITTPGSSGVIEQLLDDGRVRKLSFTGSTATGRHLLQRAATHIINCSMELGGNAPFLVLDDADIDAAIAGAMIAKMRNGGMSCVAANRFYVAANLADSFSTRLATEMSNLAVGAGFEDDVAVGPLVTEAERERISSLVDAAVAEGGTLEGGGGRPDRRGFFYLPTTLGGLAADSKILGHELFGPVAAIVPFEDLDEVIVQANDTPYGLIAYVYGRDLGRTLAIAEQLEVGMVGINRGLVSDPAAPFGGMKASGLGREGGAQGLEAYLETKYIATEW